jgi:hypothetical protein
VQDITVSDALDTLSATSTGGRLAVRSGSTGTWGTLDAPSFGKARFLKHAALNTGLGALFYKDLFVPFGNILGGISQVINTVIPFDDTPPLVTEGQEVANYSSATDYGATGVLGASVVRNEDNPFAVVSFSSPVVASAVSTVIVSVFRVIDGGAAALVYAAPFSALAVNHRMNVVFSFFDPLNSVSPTGSTVSYSVRMGVTTGTATIGGIAGGLLGAQQRTLFGVHIFQR